MRILYVFSIIIVCFTSSLTIKAQADCFYDFRVRVVDENDNFINNAKVKFDTRQLFFDNEKNAYVFWTFGGCSTYSGIFEVTNKRHQLFKKKIAMKSGYSSYELKLSAKVLKRASVFEELAIIIGRVKDINDGVIVNSRIVLTNEKGKMIETLSNENGYYRFDIQSGRYSLKFIGVAGFKVKKYENIDLKKGYQKLDVMLEV